MDNINLIVLIIAIISFVLLVVGASLVDIKNSTATDEVKMSRVQRSGIAMVVIGTVVLASILGYYGYRFFKPASEVKA
jgi:hypothetical protein